jgi:hypothetical protein
MLTLAWNYLQALGQLTNRYRLATDRLNVKRSSGVVVILATLPRVTAQVAKRTFKCIRSSSVPVLLCDVPDWNSLYARRH